MSTSQGNIFLTTENLAFSLPLILICGFYAFFKYVPLYMGVPILGGLFIVYQINAQLKAQRDKKLTNMDAQAINELAKELEGEDRSSETEDAKAKKLAKKKAAIQHRLAVEARREEKKKGKKKKSDDDDDDDVALDTFVKSNKKKN